VRQTIGKGCVAVRETAAMADVTIYHNPNCSTSKHAVATAARARRGC